MHALKAAKKQVLYWQITCFTSTNVQKLTREERRGRSGGGGCSRVFSRRLAQGSLPQARAPQARPSSKAGSKTSKAAAAVVAAECVGRKAGSRQCARCFTSFTTSFTLLALLPALGSVPLAPVPKQL